MTDALVPPKEDASSENITVNQNDDISLEPQNMLNVTTNNATLTLSSNVTESVESKINKTCDENADLKTQNCTDELTQSNAINSKDTVMEYVSGKNDEVAPKISGHIRNSLKKKRSLRLQLDNASSNSAPEIVNYETRHSNRDREIALPLLQQNSHIKNADLADFNIETLHDNVKPLDTNNKEDGENYRRPPNKSSEVNSQENSSESVEDNDNSREHKRQEIKNNSNESEERNSNDSTETSQDYKKRRPVESSENVEREDLKSSPRAGSSEERESGESSEEKSDKADILEQPDKNGASDEASVNSNEQESDSRQRYEDESKNDYDKDNLTEITKDGLKQLDFDDSVRTDPKSFRDVDLNDFSYERIQVNIKGEVESARDSHDNDSSQEELPTKGKHTDNNEHPRSEYIEKRNNGEIKPVVEINTESSNSNEFSEEEVEKKQSQKLDLNAEDKSLETLLGVKEANSAENNENSEAPNQEQKSGNVKEEFERIPLNYKHDQKTKQNNDDRPTENKENSEVANEAPADGTLETLLPKEHRYDEKLDFKFDDVAIKLPEIKLPDDIFSYNYENPHKKKNKKSKEKDRFYHYSDEHSEENPLKQIPQYDDDRGYYTEPSEDKQNYRKKENDEEDDDNVDLYEKFVRERFGKRGSFEKRSEELRNEVFRPSNPKLSETIQKILKKSEQTEKEAEKSGDPKAGYMWTLEYGENL